MTNPRFDVLSEESRRAAGTIPYSDSRGPFHFPMTDWLAGWLAIHQMAAEPSQPDCRRHAPAPRAMDTEWTILRDRNRV